MYPVDKYYSWLPSCIERFPALENVSYGRISLLIENSDSKYSIRTLNDWCLDIIEFKFMQKIKDGFCSTFHSTMRQLILRNGLWQHRCVISHLYSTYAWILYGLIQVVFSYFMTPSWNETISALFRTIIAVLHCNWTITAVLTELASLKSIKSIVRLRWRLITMKSMHNNLSIY